MNFNQVADQETQNKVKAALEKNGFSVILAKDAAEAKAKALELIPEGSEVMSMTSITTQTIGLDTEINESGKYAPVRNKLYDPSTPAREKKRLGAAPEIVTGSVHAITEDGVVIVASNTGSQLGAYTYGADKVIWVAGAQKIVKDTDSGFNRIKEYIFPLETARAKKAYGLPENFQTFDSKNVIFQREITKDRIYIILVNEVLGF